MHNNSNTLSEYYSILNRHIADVKAFDLITKQYLADAEVVNIMFDKDTSITRQLFEFNVGYSTAQKILVVLNQLSSCPKFYIEQLDSYSLILIELMKFIKNGNNQQQC